VKVVQMTLL